MGMELPRHISDYLRWLGATNHAVATIRNRRRSLTRFAAWAGSHGLLAQADLTSEALEEYRLDLFESRTGGEMLAWGTQAEYLGSLKALFNWSLIRGIISRDPSATLTLPRRPIQLPRAVLSAREVERVLHVPDTATPQGLRDRAILEVLYSTGLRRAEVANLRLGDVDREWRIVEVRAGKGQRDRRVPVGVRALRWVGRYLRRARPVLTGKREVPFLFVTSRGNRLHLSRLSESVHRYIHLAGIGKVGSCHLFRHTMATLLLEGGADIRDLQAMLGHTNLSTTARYTHVSIARLQQVHSRAHPAEVQERRRKKSRKGDF